MEMIYKKYEFNQVAVEAKFFYVENGVSECQAIFHLLDKEKNFAEQYRTLFNACQIFFASELSGFTPVFKRYFLSDAANQQSYITDNQGAVSIVQQAPLDGSKVALWLYCQTNMKLLDRSEGVTSVLHGSYEHHWTGGRNISSGDSAQQTRTLLENYQLQLQRKELSISDNCIRTWFFVQNVDVNYRGVVEARKKYFETIGLNPSTHYIASTGIEGRVGDAAALVQFDAYAVGGLQPGQQRYLYAPTHLNPTYEYGVTFERGVCVVYGDRSHLFISGTASIDNRGEIVAVHDITKQTMRMLENVETLLCEGGARWNQVMSAIVYIRDIADYTTVKQLLEESLSDIPKVIVCAPVCRPGWLIEMECIAIIPNGNPEFPCL